MTACRCGHLENVHDPRCRVCSILPAASGCRKFAPRYRPPGPRAAAVVMCQRGGLAGNTFKSFDTFEQAAEYARRRPCERDGCELVHIAVGNHGAAVLVVDDRRRLPLTVELAQLYPRGPNRVGPAPSLMNPPLRPPPPPEDWMTTREAADNWRAAADVSVDKGVHAVANAMEAAARAEEDPVMRAALGIEGGVVDDAPPWSEISEPGTDGAGA